MAQEIYHRSNWGNPTEQWGNVYLNADLTNELYKRASEYENSWVTDQLLNGVGTKPSIILTPTAYEDGVLNSVKPNKTFGSELVTNGTFDTDLSGWQVVNSDATHTVTHTSDGARFQSDTTSPIMFFETIDFILQGGRKYSLTVEIVNRNSGAVKIQGNNINLFYSDNGVFTDVIEPTGNSRISFYRNTTNVDLTIKRVSVKEITEADFDFTRGSSATRVNEQGLVQDVQLLSGELVQNGDFEQIGSELVTNGGFDTDSGWSFYNADADTNTRFENNSAILEVINAQFTRFISTTSPMTIGKFYKVTYEVTETDDTDLNIQYPNTSLNSSLGTHSVYIKSTNANIGFSKVGVGKITIDNVSVKEVGQNWSFGTGWSMGDGKAIYTGTTNSDLAQSSILTSGKFYKLQYEVINSTLVNGVVKLSGTTASAQNVLSQTVGTHTIYFTANGTAPTSLNIRIVLNTSGQYEIDNISVIEITDDTDLPRINYKDGEGSLLLEPQSTNLVTYSEDFSQSSWVKLGAGTGSVAVVTNNFAISPDGTQNASRLQCNLNGGTTTSDQSLIYDLDTTNTTKTISVYMKSNNSQNQTIYFTNTFTGDSSDEALVTTQWQRFTFTHSTSNHTFSLGLRGNTGSDDVADILIWGAQAEALSYATSYIVSNSGSTTTRLADVCNNSGNSDLINSTEGVLYAEISALANDGTNRLISLSDGTADERIFLQYSSTDNRLQFLVKNGGVTQCNIIYDASDLTAVHKVAAKYKLNDFALWVDGVEIGTDTSGNVASGLSKLQFDRGYSGLPFYGNVKCVAVFKELLSDTELQKLTTI